MPANAAVGDLVRINGVGQGGWRIAQQAGQVVQAQSYSWTPIDMACGQWSSAAMSANGMNLVVGATDGTIRTSRDGGNSWSSAQLAGKTWSAVSVNADGSVFLAAGSQAGATPVDQQDWIHRSSDAAPTWQALSNVGAAPAGKWVALAASPDGSKFVAAAQGGSNALFVAGRPTSDRARQRLPDLPRRKPHDPRDRRLDQRQRLEFDHGAVRGPGRGKRPQCLRDAQRRRPARPTACASTTAGWSPCSRSRRPA